MGVVAQKTNLDEKCGWFICTKKVEWFGFGGQDTIDWIEDGFYWIVKSQLYVVVWKRPRQCGIT